MAAEALIDTSRIGETLSSSASLTSQVMAMANAAPTAPISASALFAFGEGSSFVTRFYYSISLHSANKKGIALSAATAQGSCAHATTTTLQFMQQGECKSVIHIAVGGDLEYADELTLGRALEGRREIEG